MGWGAGVFLYKLTRNPNVTKIFFIYLFFFGGGGGKGRGRVSVRAYEQMFEMALLLFSLRRTPVQNCFEIHAYM